ncbi:MAG TPA: amylo-alpha-1,6-glucosidase [Thermoanaerobaculia bacterium]|nr:amylo-alpha-1,6-glucosidase [Thermoanaerobaculia bacterium]
MPAPPTSNREPLINREWLVTNGLGGYASGTVAGVATRRYHGYLVAALPPPFGRTMMLNHLTELLRLPDGSSALFAGSELQGGRLELHGVDRLEELSLEGGLPVWRYRVGDVLLEKRVWMPQGANTVYVSYRLAEGEAPVRLKLRPSVNFRSHDAPVSLPLVEPYRLTAYDCEYEIDDGSELPPLRLLLLGERAAFTAERVRMREMLYRIEENRGYDSVGELMCMGYFRADLLPGRAVTLIASTEPWASIRHTDPEVVWESELERRRRLVSAAHAAAREGVGAELVLAADQFLISPVRTGRVVGGDDARTVIAGYHWFTDWGRDTMISLEGLTLLTGREDEARSILRTFAGAMRDGLIPNFFPDGRNEGVYHTADATLWFFHAVDRYLQATGDRETLRELLPRLLDSAARHVAGTRFGIAVDPADGLLRQGAHGYQLTWMDAKVDEWVVTPRRGKAVEINALWYNALRLLERWVREEGAATELPIGELAARARASFNARFWYEAGGHLYDVVDCEGGDDDPALRPNQLFAFSLTHPVLDEARWAAVLQVVERELLTPVGLRSLSRQHPDYKAKYFGDLRARDAAYHQGTVWSWLIGPYLDCWRRVHPAEGQAARGLLDGLVTHLDEACIGSVSEVFDAEAPFTPRGCIAQAWGVAELLRCWTLTSDAKRNDAPATAQLETAAAPR